MSTKRTTIVDIARRAGVSIKTVSRVINNEPHVRDDKRQRVLAAMQRLSYTPNLVARDLASKSTRTVAFLFLSRERMFSREYYFTDIFDSAQKELLKNDYFTLFFAPANVPGDPVEFALDLSRRRKIAGLMVADMVGCDYDPMVRERIPVVVFHRHVCAERLTTITPRNVQGMSEIVTYLGGLGHRRIAFLGKMPGRLSSEERERGYREALARMGIAPDPRLILPCRENTAESGVETVEAFLDRKRPKPPTALCAFTDTLAVAALRVLQARGWRIPQDISVTGFDNVELCEMVHPGLTTASVPRSEMGRIAARKLIAMVSGREQGESIEVDTALVVRGSTGPAREEKT